MIQIIFSACIELHNSMKPQVSSLLLRATIKIAIQIPIKQIQEKNVYTVQLRHKT